MATFWSDSCTGTDGNSPITNSPTAGSTGATYTAVDGDSSNLFIKSNRFYLNGGGGSSRRGGIASGIPGSADYSVFLTEYVYETVDNSKPALYARYDFAANSGYRLLYQGDSLIIQKFVAGTSTDLNSDVVPGFSQGPTGTVNSMEFRLTGTTLGAYFNGSLICSATDATYSAAGRVGWTLQGFGSSTTGQHIQALSGVDTTVGTPTKLGVSSQPTTAITQRVLPTNLVIAVQTAGGSTATGDTSTVTVALNVVSGYAVITAGTLTKAAVAGLATFNDIAVTCSDDAVWTFTATDGVLTSVTTAALTGAVKSNDTVVTCT